MAKSGKDAVLITGIIKGLEKLHGRPATAADAKRILRTLKSKTPAEFQKLFGMAKAVFLTTLVDPLKSHAGLSEVVSKVLKPLAAKGKKRIGDSIKAGVAEMEAAAPKKVRLKAPKGATTVATKTPSAVASLLAPPTDPALSGVAHKSRLDRTIKNVDDALKDWRVPAGKRATILKNIRANPLALSKIGGGIAAGEAGLARVAKQASPIRSLAGKKAGFMDLLGGGITAGPDKKALSSVLEGVGSKAGRLAGKAARGGVPLILFELVTAYPQFKRVLGLDPEFEQQEAAIGRVAEATTMSGMAAQHTQDKLLAQHKARLTESDPMAMQFLMNAVSGGIPQRLTSNEVMIGGGGGNPEQQSLAGDEITRAFMGA